MKETFSLVKFEYDQLNEERKKCRDVFFRGRSVKITFVLEECIFNPPHYTKIQT